MAKQLRDILKQAHDTIKGVRASTTSPESLGKDPGVDYDPKAGDERDFVAAHSVQKWDDPAGNPDFSKEVKYALDYPKENRHGNDEAQAKKKYFSAVKEEASPKKAEDAQCNHSPKGSACPVHGLAECMDVKKINEAVTVDKKKYSWGKMVTVHHGSSHSFPLHPEHQEKIAKLKDNEHTSFTDETNTKVKAHRQGDTIHLSQKGVNKTTPVARHHFTEETQIDEDISKMSDSRLKFHATKKVPHGSFSSKEIDKEHKLRSRTVSYQKAKPSLNEHEEVEQIDEVITKKTSAGKIIKDFIDSDNPKFAGKSKEERKRMALGAYYSKHPEKSKKVSEEVELDEAIKLGTKVKIHAPGKSHHGKEGTVGEIRRGGHIRPTYYTVDHDGTSTQFPKENLRIVKEETDIEEAAKSGNILHGYHGNVKADSDADREKKYSAMHTRVKKLVGSAGHLKDAKHPNKMVKHFLDSPHGRHVADDDSDKNITSRFGHFKKSYDPALHEDLAVPLLGSMDPKLKKSKKTEQTDTPLTFPNMSVDVNTGRNV